MPPEDCPLKRDPAGWCRKGIFMEEALFKVLSFITFIMLGYLLRRLSILKAETFRVLSGIVFYITLPCIIITSINGVPVTSEMLWLVALGALCNVLMVATGYGMTHGKAGTFAMPFVAGFLPPTGFLATCLFDAGNAIMCTGGTYALANSVTDASQHLSIKSFLRNVFSSIPFCIYLIMIVMAFLHLALPHPVIIFTKIAGDANAFLCMLMIGVNINLQMDSKSFRCLIKHITVRYALSAVLAFLFYRYLPFSLEIRQATAVIALAPSSSLALIFTMKLKGDVIMAGNICSLSILLSTIAMTILLVYL